MDGRQSTVSVHMRFPTRTHPALAALAILLLSACGSGRESGESGGALLIPPPAALAVRAIDVDTLSPVVTLDGEQVQAVRQGDVWQVTTTLPPGESATLEVLWTERLDDGEPLPIASLTSEIGPFESNANITLERERYVTESASLDADDDGISNLAERDGGTNPRDPNDPGGREEPGEDGSGQSPDGPGSGTAAPALVRIFPFDPSETGAPVIDGAFDAGIWDKATFADSAGERMLINRLLIDRGAEAADGAESIPYTWFAMHDFTFLYLFVQFERGEGPFTEIRDSGARFFDDDAVNVFFDGDASRGAELDGVGGDDRYFAIPLLAESGEGPPQVFAGRPEIAPEVPPSLEFGVCLPVCNVTGWEMKVALADLNIVLDRPFGFEVQIDQDLDGGERDSRWGWAYPSITGRDGPFVPESPALFGTMTLLSEGR